jgi:hypothetical protein
MRHAKELQKLSFNSHGTKKVEAIMQTILQLLGVCLLEPYI